MNLSNRTFRNNVTGKLLKVLDSFENIVILDNKEKIDARVLLDTNIYTEQIDPSSFFNNQQTYNFLAEKIKNIPTNNIINNDDDEIMVNMPGSMASPIIDEPAIIIGDIEDEKNEIAQRYNIDPISAMNKQRESFSKYLDDEEVVSIEVDRNPVVEKDEYIKEPISESPTNIELKSNNRVQDPIINIFKNIKRNVDFSISLKIDNKIPRIDFIEMMEDSYEFSIIDFLSNEFTNNILSNPDTIKKMIKEEITKIVYSNKTKNKEIQEDIPIKSKTRRGRKPNNKS